MNYELAKKLKDSGFPQNVHFGFDERGFVGCIGDISYRDPIIVKAPSLGELIDACGERFGSLERDSGWTAFSKLTSEIDEECYGETPEEAVARLWLALKETP